LTAQSGLSPDEARADRDFHGRLVESAVGAHLANAAASGACEVYYWREHNREVDFVVRAGARLVGIEVKSARRRASCSWGATGSRSTSSCPGPWNIGRGPDRGRYGQCILSSPITMPAATPTRPRWIHVGQARDFAEGRGVAVRAGEHRVAIFRIGGALRAIQDACPHMGASLADGRIDGGQRVVCHMHGWTFDLDTGRPEGGRANCARIYAIDTRGDEVWIRLPDAPPPPKEDEWVPWSDDMLNKRGGMT
jgi:nitrite reductase/ring-hydroxylating ferredoxin subunit